MLAQRYEDVEILVVDDCSTDGTLEIIRDYQRADHRIHLHQNHRNLGLVGNWNRCAELASGDWIKYVFQDDLIHPDCLGHMMARTMRPLVFCQREILFAPGTPDVTMQEYLRIPSLYSLFGNVSELEPDVIQDAVLQERGNFFGEPTAALMHRSLFDRFGLFNPFLRQMCDYEYWIRVAVTTGIGYTSEVLATFRYHSASTSAGNNAEIRNDRVTLFDSLLLLHEFSYNPFFASLRRRGRRPRNFKRELAKLAAWMKARSAAESSRVDSPDLDWARERGTR